MKPKLALRDLFWLVLVVAMGFAWWADRRSLEKAFDEAVHPFIQGQHHAEMRELVLENAVEQEGYSIEWDWKGGSSFTVKLTKQASE